jgi:hypothetical protein
MVRFSAGVIVGCLLTSATMVSAQQIPQWFSGAQLSKIAGVVQNGYAAGASDMLNAVISWNDYLITYRPGSTLEAANLAMKQSSDCFHDHSAGGLGQFTAWLKSMWLGSDTSAAVLMLTHACPP